MADHRMIYSEPMIRALLREIAAPGTGKRMTRRIVRAGSAPLRFAKGDRLWSCEAWRTLAIHDSLKPRDLPATAPIWFEADGTAPEGFGRLRRARHQPISTMPRLADHTNRRRDTDRTGSGHRRCRCAGGGDFRVRPDRRRPDPQRLDMAGHGVAVRHPARSLPCVVGHPPWAGSLGPQPVGGRHRDAKGVSRQHRPNEGRVTPGLRWVDVGETRRGTP